MKKKELKNIAQRIANAEKIIQQSNDSKEIEKAKNEIIELTSRVSSEQDFLMLDEMIQNLLDF